MESDHDGKKPNKRSMIYYDTVTYKKGYRRMKKHVGSVNEGKKPFVTSYVIKNYFNF